jgi:hypothetical protein
MYSGSTPLRKGTPSAPFPHIPMVSGPAWVWVLQIMTRSGGSAVTRARIASTSGRSRPMRSTVTRATDSSPCRR